GGGDPVRRPGGAGAAALGPLQRTRIGPLLSTLHSPLSTLHSPLSTLHSPLSQGGLSMDPILQVDRLSISFTQYHRGLRRRTLPVIRELSLAVRPGEVTAVVGSSGSGKSLLAHAI